MQRNHDLKAWQMITENIKPLLGTKINFYAVSYPLFISYVAIQRTANKLAQLFDHKTDKNPAAENWVNDEVALHEDEINHKKFRCAPKVNYPDLQYIHQPRIFDCGDAAIAMIVGYQVQKSKTLGLAIDQINLKQFANKFDNRKINFFSGKSTDQLRSYSNQLQETTVSKDIDLEAFAYYLYHHGPILASMDELGGHFLVVKGVVDNQVIIHDPWYGPNLVCSFEDFKQKWDGLIIYYLGGYSRELEAHIAKETSQIKPK